MPSLPPVAAMFRLDMGFRSGADVDMLCRWHLSYTGGPPTDANCNTLAQDIMAAAITHLIPLMEGSNAIESMTLTDLSSDTAAQGSYTEETFGSRTTTQVPAGVAVLVNLPISRRYRGGKPRSYFPFLGGSDLATPQTWTSSAQTAVAGGLEAFLGAIEGLTAGTTAIGTLYSVSYYQGFTTVLNPVSGRTRDVPKLRTGGPVTDLITAINPSIKVGSQRRRNLNRS